MASTICCFRLLFLRAFILSSLRFLNQAYSRWEISPQAARAWKNICFLESFIIFSYLQSVGLVLAVQPLRSFAVSGQGFDQMLLHGLVVHSVLPPLGDCAV